MAKKNDRQRPRRESAPSPPEGTPGTTPGPSTPASSCRRSPRIVAGPSTRGSSSSSSGSVGVFQNPIPPPSNAPTGAPSPSRLSYADALRSRPSQPATSTRESGKRKAADDGMSVPRQRPRQSPRKTPIEQEVIEGIDKVRRKQSAEYGEMKDQPDPTNPTTPPKPIPRPSRPVTPQPECKYQPPIEDEPDELCESGDSDDSDESLASLASDLAIRRTAVDLISPLTNRIANLISFRSYIQSVLSPNKIEAPEAQQEDAATDQDLGYQIDSPSSVSLSDDSGVFSDVEDPVLPPGRSVEDNRPWWRNPDRTFYSNQAIDLSASLPTRPSCRPHRPTSSTVADASSSSSSGSRSSG